MYVPKNVNVIKRMMVFFPLICLVVFFFPTWIGAMGYTMIPGLEGANVDRILPLLMVKFAPYWLMAIILAGSLAALISTADSQILALGSIFTRDIYVSFINKKATTEKQVKMGRIFIIILCLFGFLIALRPVSTLVAITTAAFTGIGVLYPTTIAALYWKRATKWGAISSVIAGETVAVLLIYKILPGWLLIGSLPILPSLIVAASTLVVVSYLTIPPSPKKIAKFFDLFDSVFKSSDETN
jgi:SSS family solute:Na+ symporter